MLRQKRQRSLIAFAEHVYPGFITGRHHLAIADHLERIERRLIKRLIIEMPPRHGKPVYNGTMILMGDGSRKAIADIAVGDTVISDSGEPRAVTAVIAQGVLPCVRVITKSGREVIVAHDHPFLTADGWRDAIDLSVGQRLAIVPKPGTQPQQEGRPIEEFRLAGYFAGDGNTTAAKTSCQASITIGDEEIGRDIHHCAAVLGFTVTERFYERKDHIQAKAKRYNLSGGVRPWIRDAGYAGHSAHTKRVPVWVFTGNNEQIAHFVAAYFGCDGSVNRRGGARTDLVAEAYSVNKPLLQDIQHLLLRIGIRSRVAAKNGKDFQGDPHASFRLTITSQDDMACFAERVPLLGARLARLREWSVFRTTFEPDLLPDEIASIADTGEQECSCITVDVDHTYTVNDLVCHNSLVTSQLFPAWFMGRNPNQRIIAAAHSLGLAEDFSRAARNYVESAEFRQVFPAVALASDAQQVSRWAVANPNDFLPNGNRKPYLGQYVAAGVGSAITGKGADLLLIDDPVPGAAEAHSQVQLEHIWEWWTMTARTRLHRDGIIIIIMTRWSEGDLTGRLMHAMQEDPEAEQWTVLRLPALAEANDPLGREEGEALWPEMFDREALLALQKGVGTRGFTALYQQRPSPDSGEIFLRTWFSNRYTQSPTTIAATADYILQVWDTAFERKRTSDYSVCATWARKGNSAYLLDVFRDRLEFPELKRKAVDKFHQWKPRKVLVEDSASGKPMIQELERETALPLIRVPVVGDKISRAHAVTPRLEAGQCYFPEDAQWIDEYIEEHVAFDRAMHDDQVDTTAIAIPAIFESVRRDVPRVRPGGADRTSPYLSTAFRPLRRP